MLRELGHDLHHQDGYNVCGSVLDSLLLLIQDNACELTTATVVTASSAAASGIPTLRLHHQQKEDDGGQAGAGEAVAVAGMLGEDGGVLRMCSQALCRSREAGAFWTVRG